MLSSFFSSAPGVSGHCELAIRKTRTKTELWIWNDECGPEQACDLPETATWRDVVESMVGNEQVSATIDPESVEILPSGDLIGQIYALAWSADEEDQRAALLLARLDDQSLEDLAQSYGSLLSARLRSVLETVSQKFYDLDVEPGDLESIALTGTKANDVRKAFYSAARRLIKHQNALEKANTKKLLPFEGPISDLLARWAATRPPGSRYPGSSYIVPPAGYVLLTRYLRTYVLEHGALPTGVHQIPGGVDGVRGVIPSMLVDFDHLES